MKAMIFAAGLGTRLQPLTNDKPKALVQVNGKTLLENAINKIIRAGINEVIINVHHFAHQVIDFVKEKNSFGIDIRFSDESGKLLDTGGGLKKASWFLKGGEPFLIYNVDILSDIDLRQMISFHKENKVLVTLAVRERKTSRYLLFDEVFTLCGWQNVKTGEKKIPVAKPDLKPFAFSGIHIIEPAIFNLMTESGRFSIIDVYLRLAKECKILGYDHSETQWFDLGRIENLKEAEKV
ncbi:MAG: nucleotidyltransferase family protein [Chlorobi bacterium]|nr:nucleotidyltransferase family protein [Chlorobiota bacterium]